MALPVGIDTFSIARRPFAHGLIRGACSNSLSQRPQALSCQPQHRNTPLNCSGPRCCSPSRRLPRSSAATCPGWFSGRAAAAWLLLPGALALALFAWLLTLHPSAAGRTYAAYGGMYIAVALVWLRWSTASR